MKLNHYPDCPLADWSGHHIMEAAISLTELVDLAGDGGSPELTESQMENVRNFVRAMTSAFSTSLWELIPLEEIAKRMAPDVDPDACNCHDPAPLYYLPDE